MPEAVAAIVIRAVISTIVSFALSALTRALFPKPKPPDLRHRGRKFVVRASIEAHQVGYGTTMESGPLVFAESTGPKNQFLHLVVPVAAHEIEAIDSIWLNDVEIENSQLDGSGNVTSGRFKDHVRIKKHLGTEDQAADSDLVSEVENWTEDHRGLGIAYVYLRLEFDLDVFPTGIPNMRAVIRGRKVWDPRSDPGDPSVRSFSNNGALCQLDYLMSDFGFAVPLAEIHEASWLAAANVCDEQVAVGLPGSPVGSEAEDFVADPASDKLILSNVRNWQRGDVVQFSTTDTLPAPLAVATDYYVIPSSAAVIKAADTLADARAGIVIDVTDGGSGTHTATRNSQLRYTCDGSFQVDQKPAAIMEDLLTASAGAMVYQQGTFRGYAGAATTATGTLDESDLRGKIDVTPRPSRSESFNAIRGTFVDADDDKAPFTLTDFPPITNATFESQDGGERVFNEIELPFTTNKTRAQRIANLFLHRARQGISVRFPAKLNKLDIATWDVLTVSIARLGWTDKEFRVLEWALAEDGGVDLKLQEEAAAVYDFDPADEITIDSAPDTNLPDPFTSIAPTGLTLTSGTSALFLKADGTVVSRIKASWTASADTFVREYQVQFRRGDAGSPAPDWQPATPPGAETSTFVWDVEDGVAYDVRVRASNTLGVKSAWLTASGHVVVGKTTVPADVTGFTAAQNGNAMNFRWTQVGDIDLAGYEIRFNPKGTATWADATPLTEVTRGTAITNAQVPPGDWTFLIKARDTSGNESTNPDSTDAKMATLDFDIILQEQQAPRWAGALAGFVKHHTGVLVPDSQNLASDDGFETFDLFVPNPVASAIYEAPVFDVGFDDTVRVWADVASALGPGVASGVADPALEIDYREDTGAFDGFEPWAIGNVEARFVKLRIALDTAKGLAKVTGFKPTVDLFERTEGAKGVTVTAGGQAIAFARAFHATPRVSATADATSARIATKENVTTTGFTAHVFDTGGTDVGGNLDWQATGA